MWLEGVWMFVECFELVDFCFYVCVDVFMVVGVMIFIGFNG